MNVERSSEQRLQRKQLMHQAMLWLEKFVEYGSIVCLFLKGGNSSRLQFGYYSCDGNNLWKMVTDAFGKAERAEGIYFSINPVEISAFERSPNCLSNVAGLKDVDIVRRRLLFIDLDPVRQSQVRGASTDEEKNRR